MMGSVVTIKSQDRALNSSVVLEVLSAVPLSEIGQLFYLTLVKFNYFSGM